MAEQLLDAAAVETERAFEWRYRNLGRAAPALLAACKQAVAAAEHVIAVCETDLANGESPNPHVRSAPHATYAECYAAMAFVTEARAAIALAEPTE